MLNRYCSTYTYIRVNYKTQMRGGKSVNGIKYHIPQIIFISLSITSFINPCRIRSLKSTCIIGCITAGGYMLYNDYKFLVASYGAIKAERSLNQLLNDLATGQQKESPDPAWCVAQHKQIKIMKETAVQYQHKALLTRFLFFLVHTCKQRNPFTIS